MARVISVEQDKENKHFTLECPFGHELKIDQSVAHNGVCLTVVKIDGDCYVVTAMEETLKRSNLGNIQAGDCVNVERSMMMNGRLDGHIVQGHVDQTGICTRIENANGSFYYTFAYDASTHNLTIEKGSITVNGVSLTVVDSQASHFSVAIIPYTYEHTNFKDFKVGTRVNLEFDVIGKYVSRLNALRI